MLRENARPMKTADFDYELPPELIAQHPAAGRGDSRLLHLGDQMADRSIRDLPSLLRPGDLLVTNDTRVVRARLLGRKATGGRAEILVERVLGEREALAMVSGSRSLRDGACIEIAGGAARVEIVSRQAPFLLLRLSTSGSFADLLERHGQLPLPPYIRHVPGQEDEARYQTVFAREPGAMAAPTAGLHFDDALLAALAERGVGHACLTLHVGAGTFQPVRVEDIREHRMHAERFTVSPELAARVARTRANGGRVLAVGTTCVRALESAVDARGELVPQSAETRIFITPGYRFRTIDLLLTNFHLPQSTLLMLVSAFAGHARMQAAYAHAVRERYRFFSYGDAMLIEPGRAP